EIAARRVAARRAPARASCASCAFQARSDAASNARSKRFSPPPKRSPNQLLLRHGCGTVCAQPVREAVDELGALAVKLDRDLAGVGLDLALERRKLQAQVGVLHHLGAG